MKDINFKISDDDYRKLKWVADKWEMGVSECLRMLIPNVKLPDAKIVDISEIRSAGPHDFVSVENLSENNKGLLRGYLKELIDKNWAVTLAREIKQQVLDKDGKSLSISTYKRLSRWSSPYRHTEREQFVQPRAKKIAELLFGDDIDRID
jgi:hypothetical protein